MIAYSVVLLLMAAVFTVVAVRIYKGNTNLIHDYHQTKVTDKAAYGNAFGKAFSLFPATMAVSAVTSLAGEGVAWIAVAVLLVGFAVGIVCIFRVQKKYNGGLL